MVQSKKTGLSCYCCESMDIGLLFNWEQQECFFTMLTQKDAKRVLLLLTLDVISSQDYKKRNKTNQV